jgi:outer membrane scaffolding protein for murein synthesis (MipA/OmpV family)
MMQANADYTPDYYGDDDTEFNPPPFFSIYDYGPFDYDQYD